MKKLLSILGAITITASPAAFAISCGSSESSDDDKGTQFIDGNGDLNLNLDDVIKNYKETNGTGIDSTFMKSFYNLSAVAIMQEAWNYTYNSDGGEDQDNIFSKIKTTNSQYALSDMAKTIADLFGASDSQDDTTVRGAANKAFDSYTSSYKDKNGNIKKDDVVDALHADSTYTYINKDYDSLKKAYINNQILNSDSMNAYTILTNTLVKSYQKDLNNNSKDSSTNKNQLLSSLVSIANDENNSGYAVDVAKLKEAIKDGFKSWDGTASSTPIAVQVFCNALNATGGTAILTDGIAKTWNQNSINWATVSTMSGYAGENGTDVGGLIDELLNRLDWNYFNNNSITTVNFKEDNNTPLTSAQITYTKTNTDSDRSNTFFDLVDWYPLYNNESWSTTNGNSINGFLTNSQRYIMDKYYETQKPLAVSDVLYSKGSDDSVDLSTNINAKSFLNLSSTESTAAGQYTGLIDFLTTYTGIGTSNNNNDSNNLNDDETTSEYIDGTSLTNWDTIFNNDSDNVGNIKVTTTKNGESDTTNWSSDFFSATNNEKLLTLSSSDSDYSNIYKFSVYDFISHPDQDEYQLYSPTSLTEDSSWRDNLISFLKNSNNMGGVSGDQLTDAEANVIADQIEAYEATTGVDENKKDELCNEIATKLEQTIKLITDLNRRTNSVASGEEETYSQNVYKVINKKEGIIAFIDTDGLRFVKVNGYELLSSESQDNNSTISSSSTEQTVSDDYTKEALAFNRLSELSTSSTDGRYRYIYGDYNNSNDNVSLKSNDSDAINFDSTTSESIKKYGVNYSDLNTSVTNTYEKYLVNTSLNQIYTDSNNDAFYKYDIFDNMMNFISSSDSSTSSFDTWLMDYFSECSGLTTNELIKSLFNFSDYDYAHDLENAMWIEDQIVYDSYTNFETSWESWNKTIEAAKTGETTDNVLPQAQIDSSNSQDVLTYKGFEVNKTNSLEKLLSLENQNKNYSLVFTNINSYVDSSKKGGRK